MTKLKNFMALFYVVIDGGIELKTITLCYICYRVGLRSHSPYFGVNI